MNIAPLRVFISYAWESEAFKEVIWKFASWLYHNSEGKYEIVLDQLFEFRPPEVGWPTWMLQEIKKADVVLAICSPKYRERFEGENTNGGNGVRYEGAIITQHMYSANLRNTKFYPVLPDDYAFDHIPDILKGFHNGHCFPSKQERIIKLILGENPSFGICLANSHQDELELEEEIVKEVVSLTDSFKETAMAIPIQVTIRSYLSLSDLHKIAICKAMGLWTQEMDQMSQEDRDKEFFKLIGKSNLLGQLWIHVHRISPFENPNNPFIKP